MKKILLTTAICLLGIASAWAKTGDVFSYQGTGNYKLRYKVNYDATTVTCTGLYGDSHPGAADLVIPEKVYHQFKEYRVTDIGGSAFFACQGFTGSLIIPDGVTDIGGSAFYGCYGFTGSLIIPDGVTHIGGSAFEDCSGFTGNLTIGNSVESIGDDAFKYCDGFTGTLTIGKGLINIYDFYDLYELPLHCDGFTEFAVSEDNADYSSVDGVLYNKDKTKIILCPKGKTGSLTIPDGVTSIEGDAFDDCSGINKITVLATTPPTWGDGVHLYENLNNLKVIYVPQGTRATYMTTYEWGGFVRDLHFIEIGDTEVLTINIAKADYPWEKSETLLDKLDAAGKHPSVVRRLKISGTLGDDDWDLIKNNMTALYDLDLTEITNTEIPSEAFKSSKIAYFKFPQGLTSIGYDAFRESNLCDTLYLPSSIISIGWSAFRDCDGLTGSLTIPNSVVSIWDDAFHGCSGLSGTLTIPNNVENIGEKAFYGCYSFTGNLTIGNSVKSIGREAFDDCSGLSGKVRLPDSLSIVDYHLFSYCSNITHVVIPAKVGIISSYAFYGCYALDTITYLAVNPTIPTDYSNPTYDYNYVTNFQTIDPTTCILQVPIGAKNNYAHAEVWGDFLNIHEIDIDGIITFNSNGGKGSMTSQSVIKGSSLTISENTFTKEGYTFIGWATDSTSAEAEYTDGENITLADDMELYAIWAVSTYTLTFNDNGGTGTANDTIITYNDTIGTLPVLTKDGYTFDGWKIGETEITDETVWKFTENQEATAQWSANEYTLTFNANGGEGVSDDITVTYDVAIGSLPMLTKEGYTFDGWKIGNDEIADTTIWVFTQDKEAIAQWVANKYTLFFDANGGTGTMDAQIFTYDIASAITTNTFTKENYTFIGWVTDSTSTTAEYTDGEEITLTDDIELYVVWKKASSIRDANVAVPFTQVGNTLYFEESTDIAVYNISGLILYSGEASEYTLPSRMGVYIICTNMGAFKIVNN